MRQSLRNSLRLSIRGAFNLTPVLPALQRGLCEGIANKPAIALQPKHLPTYRILLTPERFAALQEYMPILGRLAVDWKLFYSPAVHGVSLDSFYRQAKANSGPSLILMQDTEGTVFGGFAPSPWERRPAHSGFYGDGSACVFSFRHQPAEFVDDQQSLFAKVLANFEAYPASPSASTKYMFSDEAGLSMGAAAWHVDPEFMRATTNTCVTYETYRPLASKSEVILTSFEAWTLWPDAPAPQRRSSTRLTAHLSRVSRQLSMALQEKHGSLVCGCCC